MLGGVLLRIELTFKLEIINLLRFGNLFHNWQCQCYNKWNSSNKKKSKNVLKILLIAAESWRKMKCSAIQKFLLNLK